MGNTTFFSSALTLSCATPKWQLCNPLLGENEALSLIVFALRYHKMGWLRHRPASVLARSLESCAAMSSLFLCSFISFLVPAAPFSLGIFGTRSAATTGEGPYLFFGCLRFVAVFVFVRPQTYREQTITSTRARPGPGLTRPGLDLALAQVDSTSWTKVWIFANLCGQTAVQSWKLDKWRTRKSPKNYSATLRV